jgi:malate dehydrogenase
MRPKVTIVGAGMTGGTMAQKLAESGHVDVVLFDIIDGLPQGKALDLAEEAPHAGFSSRIIGTNSWADTKNSQVVVITSGVPRKPGMTREELLNINAGIVRDVARNAAKWSPRSIFIIFANPMDVMCHVALQASKFPAKRVIGQGGMLDSARYRTFIAFETKSSPKDVHAQVLGGHTEATMVPVVSTAHVGGVPLTKLLSKKKIDAVVQRAKNGGAEIVGLLKTGSAYYAPAAATVEMVEAVLLDQKRILPCATLASGQYGINGTYVGLPVKVGARGIEAVYAPPLWPNEIEGIQKAAESTKELVGLIEKPKRATKPKAKAHARK